MKIISKEEYESTISYAAIFAMSGFDARESGEFGDQFWEASRTMTYEDYVEFMQPYVTKLNKYLTATEET